MLGDPVVLELKRPGEQATVIVRGELETVALAAQDEEERLEVGFGGTVVTIRQRAFVHTEAAPGYVANIFDGKHLSASYYSRMRIG